MSVTAIPAVADRGMSNTLSLDNSQQDSKEFEPGIKDDEDDFAGGLC